LKLIRTRSRRNDIGLTQDTKAGEGAQARQQSKATNLRVKGKKKKNISVKGEE